MDLEDFDWRMYGVASLTQDLPAAGPGAPFHPAGTPVFSSIMAQWNDTTLTFGTPSTIKLAFDIALTASYEGLMAKDQIELMPHGNGLMIHPKGFPYLYTYFEQFMSSVIFSYQTLEIFCNFIIASNVGKGTAYVQLDKRKGSKHYNATELQREGVSLVTKLNEILPKIHKVPPLEEGIPGLWDNFKQMKGLRDRITHMRPVDVNRGAAIDRDSVFAEIINGTTVNFPYHTLKIMEYYDSGLRPKIWLVEMREHYIEKFRGFTPRFPKGNESAVNPSDG